MAVQRKTNAKKSPRVALARKVAEADSDVAKATASDGTVDTQAAAMAGAKRRQEQEAAKGGVQQAQLVRQLEDDTETDRRLGADADKSIIGEKLPVLRPNEPDPRQGVTTGDTADLSAPSKDVVAVTFSLHYASYNPGESAAFERGEAERLIDLGVATEHEVKAEEPQA